MKAAFTPDPDSPDSLAEFVLDTVRAAERAGASAAEAQISTGDGLDVTVRAGACETVQHERDKSLAITVYVDHRKGTATTSDFTAQAIEETIGAALRIARHTEADPHAGPIDASYLSAPEDLPNLALDYPWPLDAEEAIQLALECERAATGHDARIRQSDGCNVTRYRGTHAYANQHGFAGAWTATRHGLSAIMIAADDDGAMQRGYWYTTARDSSTLEDAEAVGRRAAERTAAKLGAAKIPTCECPVLFEAGVSAGLIRHLLAAISGGAQYRRASFLQDALGDALAKGVQVVHQAQHRRKDGGGEDRQHIKAGAAGHADRHRQKHEAHVAGLLDRVAEADDRQRPDQRKGARDIGADDQHDQRRDHAHDHQRLREGLGVGSALVRRAVDPGDGRRQGEPQGQHDSHVGEGEHAGDVLEALHSLDHLVH